jgi:hypothetical protein
LLGLAASHALPAGHAPGALMIFQVPDLLLIEMLAVLDAAK